jgi:hypothetical protein
MPYIKKVDRIALESPHSYVSGPGALNYLITQLINRYLGDHDPVRYQTINDIVGALEGAKMELYRRVAVPFEDLKRKENGDVY